MHKAYKVIVRSDVSQDHLHRVPDAIGWDLKGESAWATVKGAESRRKVVARKFPRYDTGVLTPGGHIIQLTKAPRPWLNEPEYQRKPAAIKKRRLTPRNPNYGK